MNEGVRVIERVTNDKETEMRQMTNDWNHRVVRHSRNETEKALSVPVVMTHHKPARGMFNLHHCKIRQRSVFAYWVDVSRYCGMNFGNSLS